MILNLYITKQNHENRTPARDSDTDLNKPWCLTNCRGDSIYPFDKASNQSSTFISLPLTRELSPWVTERYVSLHRVAVNATAGR